MPNLEAELLFVSDVARRAGEKALTLRQNLVVQLKPDNQGPVTNVDKELDEFINACLRKKYPSDEVISEESFSKESVIKRAGRVWFVDPIDGTSAIVQGRNDFVVMIGLAIDGEPRLGVIYQPTTDILWRGIVQGSASYAQRIEGEAISPVSGFKNIDWKDIILLASKSHRSKRQQALIERIAPKKVLYHNSIGLKAMYVLDGCADLYVCWSKRVCLWDTCAPAAIAMAAGGYMAFLDGRGLSYEDTIEHGQSIIVSRCKPDDSILNVLNEIAQTPV